MAQAAVAAVRWKEWKRYCTRLRNLRALGIPEGPAREWAGSRKGYWRISGAAPHQRPLRNACWTALGLRAFTDHYDRLRGC
jgi:RNA-directed DNA polymerase